MNYDRDEPHFTVKSPGAEAVPGYFTVVLNTNPYTYLGNRPLDLSEAALGWMTFNGDHMSMYHVNAGVPKTLVRFLVRWAAEREFADPARQTLNDVVATVISPILKSVNTRWTSS